MYQQQTVPTTFLAAVNDATKGAFQDDEAERMCHGLEYLRKLRTVLWSLEVDEQPEEVK